MEKIPDEVYIQNWRSLLSLFHKIDGSKKESKEKYQSLIELAKTKTLTSHQIDGIIARCNYRIHLIDNPNEEPFSNMEKKEKRLNLPSSQSNGQP